MNAVKHTLVLLRSRIVLEIAGNRPTVRTILRSQKNETSWKKTIIGDRKDIADLQVL